MKNRKGCVSNSSSSSFCILGISFDNKEKYYEQKIDDIYTDLDDHNAIGEYDDRFYVGLSPESMKDGETLLQFKQRIIDKLKEEGLNYNTNNLSWITDGGYDG